jgi:GTPase SAR1 family protein
MSSRLGKIGILGPGGAGKTRMLVELVNRMDKRYEWDEEKQFLGSLSVTPFHVTFPLKNKSVKCTLVDNPGQNSLEKLRMNAAKSDGKYLGFVLVVDSCSWNFREIAIWHTKAIEHHLSLDTIPLNIITNKSDLATLLLGKLGNYIGEIIEEAFDHLKNYDKVFYFNRITSREEFFQITLYEGWVPFTQIEQYLTNSLDAVFVKNQVEGFTQVNIRTLIRSILLGFCQFYQEYHPEFVSSNPIFNAIDDELVNSLNYFRGTSYETSTPFNILAAQSKTGLTHKNEIPFHISSFEKKNIIFILNKYVVAQEKNFQHFVSKIKTHLPSWNVIDATYTNSVTDDGISKIRTSLASLLEYIDEHTSKKEDKQKLSYDKLGLSNFK